MEYIPEAQTLIRYATDEKLTTHDQLELFAKVCEAVQHGHQKGIIHRDLKPDNILVDTSGQVKVIDFGVARSTDLDVAITTLRTDVGQLIGTMQYMSPEQCAADPDDLDTRSDVYALGVVLYELLCGQPPYDMTRVAIFEATRVVREEVPTRPSTINRKLRGDIETLVLKALEKDRDNRYQSAAELAADIRRFLKGEPIDARPPTAWTRGVRWVVERPVKATVVTCLFMAAIIIGATYLAVWFVDSRPYEIVRYRDGQIFRANKKARSLNDVDEVRLLARSGKKLYTWGRGTASVYFSDLVDRPTELGGGRLVVLGFSEHHDGPLRGVLCAFDIEENLDEPAWQCRVGDGNPLPDPYERGYRAAEFHVKNCWLNDVFSNSPGPEVVVVFGHRTSQRIIRIYDLDGHPLYETWHDGTAQSCYWMADPRLLVFAGSDATVNWDSNGRVLEAGGDPLVVFAIRPQLGEIEAGYTWRFGEDEDANLAWRRYLHSNGRPVSVDVESAWALRVQPSLISRAQKGYVTVSIVKKETSAALSWDLDEFGNELPQSRRQSEGYQRNRRRYPEGDPQRLPDPDEFSLEPAPLVVPTSRPAEASQNR